VLGRMGVNPDQWARAEQLRQQMEMRQQALQGLNDPVMRANFANERTVAPPYRANEAGVLDQYGGGMQWSPGHMAGAGLDTERTTTEGYRQGALVSQGRANEALAGQRNRMPALVAGPDGKKVRRMVEKGPNGWTATDIEPDASQQREHKQTDSPLGMYQWAFKNALDKSFRPSDPNEIAKAQDAALAVVRAQYPGWTPDQGGAPAGPAQAPPQQGAGGYYLGQEVDTPMGRTRVIGFDQAGEPLVDETLLGR